MYRELQPSQTHACSWTLTLIWSGFQRWFKMSCANERLFQVIKVRKRSKWIFRFTNRWPCFPPSQKTHFSYFWKIFFALGFPFKYSLDFSQTIFLSHALVCWPCSLESFRIHTWRIYNLVLATCTTPCLLPSPPLPLCLPQVSFWDPPSDLYLSQASSWGKNLQVKECLVWLQVTKGVTVLTIPKWLLLAGGGECAWICLFVFALFFGYFFLLGAWKSGWSHVCQNLLCMAMPWGSLKKILMPESHPGILHFSGRRWALGIGIFWNVLGDSFVQKHLADSPSY